MQMAVAVVKGTNSALLTRMVVVSLASGTAIAYAWWFTLHKANVDPMNTFYKKQAAAKK
jgi:hypothetical protein